MKTRRILQTAMVLLLMVTLLPVAAEAQNTNKKKKKKKKDEAAAVVTVTVEALGMYDKGAHEELIVAVDAAQEDGALVNPDALYLQGQSHEAGKASAAASASYGKLVDLAETDAWHFIGVSSRSVLDGQLEVALAAADQATTLDETNLWAHYQRGMVLTRTADFVEAAGAFTHALELDGALAYGHYWAGMSYYQTKNLVAAANHLRRFVELAPEAPERLQAQGILATIQG